MDKDVRKLVAQAMDQGFEFSEGANTYKLLPPDKTKSPVFISKTPSSQNAKNRILADLKRSGFVVPDRKKKGGK